MFIFIPIKCKIVLNLVSDLKICVAIDIMKNYTLLKELLPYIQSFEARQRDEVLSPVADFSAWLQKEISRDVRVKDTRAGHEQPEKTRRSEDVRTTISKMVYMMYRYARFYTKKAMVTSKINSLDDFALLVTLRTHKSLIKGELIKMFVLEKTTGIEIINRLVRNGLARQEDSVEDKRSKEIAITEKGKSELNIIFAEMAKTSEIVTGNLEEEEQLELIRLLTKLDKFHNELVNTEDLESIDEYARTAEKMRSDYLDHG